MTWLLLIYMTKGYGQYDLMFQEFSSESSCLVGEKVVKAADKDIKTACIKK